MAESKLATRLGLQRQEKYSVNHKYAEKKQRYLVRDNVVQAPEFHGLPEQVMVLLRT